MVTFTARSSSTEVRARSRPAKRRNKRPPSSIFRRTHNGKKKATSRATQSLRSPLSFVYVGNLKSDVRNEDLEQLFAPCGKVIKIDIRCCSGTAVPSASTNANTVYATVLFASVEGATQALFMHGSALLGKSIFVAPSFLALPEARRAIRRKPISVCGVNLTKISDKIQHTVNRIYTGGTRVMETEDEDY